jgi:hypothetical protein
VIRGGVLTFLFTLSDNGGFSGGSGAAIGPSQSCSNTGDTPLRSSLIHEEGTVGLSNHQVVFPDHPLGTCKGKVVLVLN